MVNIGVTDAAGNIRAGSHFAIGANAVGGPWSLFATLVGQDGPSLSYQMTLPSDYNFRLVVDTALPVTDSTGKAIATKQPGMLLLTEAPTAAGAGAAQAISASFTVN